MNDMGQRWEVIEILMQDISRKVMTAGGLYCETRTEESANLPLVLAYALLEEILSELKDNGFFPCAKWQLGAKMHASKNILPWVDFDLVDEGRDKRNGIAHSGYLLAKNECRRYVDAIKIELQTWGGLH